MEKKIDTKSITKLVVIAVIAAGLGFYGGMTYEKGTSAAVGTNLARGAGQFGAGGARGGTRAGGGAGGAGFVSGDILSKDANGITVKTRDGGSRIIIISSATSTFKPEPIQLDALNVGDSVMVMGKANTDGSYTADSIQVRTGTPGQPPAPGQGAATNVNATTQPAK